MSNLTSGFTIGDRITVFTLYTGYQQSFTFAVPAMGVSTVVYDMSGVVVGTATGGGLTGTLVLVAVPVVLSLRYFTVQQFLDYHNLKEYNADQENGIKPQQVILVGSAVEADIDQETNTKFDTNSGSYYSATEYHDTRYAAQSDYFLRVTPVISLTTFEVQQIAEENTDSWTTLTADTDYNVDLETGRVRIKTPKQYAQVGKRHVRATYKYGYSSVPNDIRLLAIISTGMQLMGSSFLRARINDKSSAMIGDATYQDGFNSFRQRVLNNYINLRIYPT